MEKVKFSSFWKSRMIRMLVADGEILLCVSILFLLYTNSLVKKEIALKLSDTVQAVLTCADCYEEESTAIKYGISIHADSWKNSVDGMDYAMMICNSNTKEEIAVSKAGTFIFLSEDEEIIKVLHCDSEALLELQKKYEDRSKIFYMTSCYIKGNEFLPGKVEVIDTSTNETVPHKKNVIEEIDFSPENAEGYTYYTGNMNLFVYGTSKEGKAMQILDEMMQSGERVNNKKDAWGTYTGAYLFTLDKEPYILHYVCTVDFWKVCGWVLALMWGIGAVIFLGDSWFEADRAYRQYSTQYEMDAYRRHMTAALAHDLKTPLAAIMGYSVNLKENIHSEKKDYYLDSVIENVQYMNDIISSTLELAKVEEHTRNLNKTSMEPVSIAKELLAKYSVSLEERGIKVEISGNGQVTGDKNLLSRAIDNLLSNAVKYTPDNGKILIKADKTSFSIANTCDKNLAGNTEDFCKAFAKSDDSRSDRKGSGIGLTIVRNIVVLHGLGFEVSAADGMFKAIMRKE